VVAFTPPARRSYSPRVDNSLGICFKTGADHAVVADGRHLVHRRDMVCVRPPGCVWSSDTELNRFTTINIGPELLPEAGSLGPMTFLPRRGIFRARPLIDSLISADSPLALDEIVAAVMEALLTAGAPVSDEWRGTEGHRHAAAHARDYLHSKLDASPTLDEIAVAVGMNKFVLLRRFREAFRVTPHEYLVMARLGRARELICRGWTPSEAAAAAGFADQAHLTRWFRRNYDMTPARYRREVWSAHTVPGLILR